MHIEFDFMNYSSYTLNKDHWDDKRVCISAKTKFSKQIFEK